VDKIVPSHTATFEEDFSLLQEEVSLGLQLKVIDDFLNEKIEQTHIVIDPMFKDCDFRRPGWRDKFIEAD
jgi:peptidyl-prolyl cis-trans isomerase SurA